MFDFPSSAPRAVQLLTVSPFTTATDGFFYRASSANFARFEYTRNYVRVRLDENYVETTRSGCPSGPNTHHPAVAWPEMSTSNFRYVAPFDIQRLRERTRIGDFPLIRLFKKKKKRAIADISVRYSYGFV